MIILGIESSCDDTSVALVKATSSPDLVGIRRASFSVLAEKTASQIEVHKKYGGVVPEIAGRMHAENIMPVVEEIMKNQKIPNAIAVTSGPGLITGLLVGVEAAKTLSYLWKVPIVSVNHISGHIHSVEIRNPKFEIQNKLEFPALCLIVSGGHTELILMEDHNRYKLIGKTRDDAAGETFDKVAKLIGFDYPGGAKISQTAEGGKTDAIGFPRPMINEGYEFSFAGLKTSALYWLRDNANQQPKSKGTLIPTLSRHKVGTSCRDYKLQATSLKNFCASFQQAIIDVLTTKTLRAIREYKPKTVILSGGVSANKKLKETLQQEINKQSPNTKYLIPDTKYSMDNAAMIAVAGYYKAIKKDFTNWKDIQADPNWEVYK